MQDIARSCGVGQVSLGWTRIVIGKVADGVGDSQIRVCWNRMLDDWNEARVGSARDMSDGVEAFVDWNGDVIVGHEARRAEVQWPTGKDQGSIVGQAGSLGNV